MRGSPRSTHSRVFTGESAGIAGTRSVHGGTAGRERATRRAKALPPARTRTF